MLIREWYSPKANQYIVVLADDNKLLPEQVKCDIEQQYAQIKVKQVTQGFFNKKQVSVELHCLNSEAFDSFRYNLNGQTNTSLLQLILS